MVVGIGDRDGERRAEAHAALRALDADSVVAIAARSILRAATDGYRFAELIPRLGVIHSFLRLRSNGCQ